MNIQMSQLPVLVGERIVWLGSGSGLPLSGTVRWMGKLPEMGPDWAVGIELDHPLPYGGIDGTWGNRHLFTCESKHGLLVPVSTVIRESDLYKRHARNSANRNPVKCVEEHAVSHVEPQPREETPPPPAAPVVPPSRPTRRAPQPPVSAPREPPKEIPEVEQVPCTKESSFFESGSTTGSDVTSKKTPSEASSYSTASTVSKDSSEVERLTAQLTLPKGLADFKADLEATPCDKNMNTLAVNRLLRRLEASIAGGQHVQAAGLAKDLARLKISCSVTRQRRSLDVSPACITVEMYVEDKVSHQGPIPLQVTPTLTVAQLKEKVQGEFEIPVGVQRWILGKMLASDDTKTLDDHNVSSNGCPLFLYLVAPDTAQEPEPVDVITPLPAVDEPEATVGRGWYYNEEDDRYSFCEDSEEEEEDEEEDEDEDEEEEHAGLRHPNPDQVLVQHQTALTAVDGAGYINYDADEEEEDEEDDDQEEEEDVEVVVVHEKPIVMLGPPVAVGRLITPPIEPSGYKYVAGQATTMDITRFDQNNPPGVQIINRSPQPFIPLVPSREDEQPPQVSEAGPSSKHLRVVEVARLQDSKFDTLKLGWRCPLCTLVNAPTRPGCAACTTERPIRYVVPVHYRANQQELQRIQQEQQQDHQLQEASAREKEEEVVQQHQHYQQLVNLDNTVLVPSVEAFDCSVCLVTYDAGVGVLLRECLHTFCRSCLLNTVQFSEEAEIKCPYRDAEYACDSVLQEREIKALVPADVYEQHLAKSISQAENKIGNAFHCKTPNCRGWCIFEDNVNEFQCPVCIKVNCLTCQAIHGGLNCKQYQEQVRQESETNAEARRTREMLEEMVERGEAMTCPTCQVVLMKKWGCDWLRCSMCKTEICWVTRGPRWGIQGKGDVSGGCRCGLNGVKCHPRCNYCH